MSKSLSIVVPAFNEENRLGESVVEILRYVSENLADTELIVVDDGSSDNTSAVAENAASGTPQIDCSVIRYEENKGKGFAVRTGLHAAKGDIAIFSDADLSTPIEELKKLVDPIADDLYDVTLGSRAIDRTMIGERQPWRREQGGKVFNFFVRTLTGLPFWDTQCGFKAFNMNKFRPLLDKMKIDRFGFDVEFLYVANMHGLRMKEIPVRWNHCDGTKVSIFRDSIRMFTEISEIRRNAKQGQYD
ncbi:MAG: glycosyltransferase family 2 protein [Pyrinomonadaceae bacterium]|nr:glycosyltransferase family 2 protein [Pyrinomonadaceae bacterium]